MHGFCTDFARFQNVQRVLFAAKSDKECRNYRVKNYVALIKNNDNSKLPETETNRRLALLISGPRVRVPEGAPNFERQIVRFDVLSLCRKAAAHVLHTICTFPEYRVFLRKVRTACFPLHKKNFYANRTLVNSLRSSASISRMASRISLPVIFVASGFSFCRGWGAAGVRSWV